MLDSCKRRKLKMMESLNIDEFPDDLLVKILCQLPCKSAVQCKSVCKRWLFLISDPDFVQLSINKHHQLHQQSYKCLDFVIEYDEYWSYIPPMPPRTHLQSISSIPNSESLLSHDHLLKFLPCFREQNNNPEVVACSNDLIVCCESYFFQRIYYICNPITKQWLKLPPSPECHESVYVGFVCYPLDKKQQTINSTSTSNNICKSFKLISITKFTHLSYNINVEIFCSETGKWSQSVVSSPQALGLLSSSDVFVALNGILHWVNLEEQTIVAYDLDDQRKCRIIEPPVKPIECLGVCRGRLRISNFKDFYLFLQSHEDVEATFTIWELEDYNAGKWQLVHKVEVKDMIAKESWLRDWTKYPFTYPATPPVRMLAFHPLDADMVYLAMRPHLVSYNMQSRELLVVNDQLPPEWDHQTHFALVKFFPFVHSWWPIPVPPLPDH